MELKQIGKRTYYIPYTTNIGIYKLSDNKVCIIDTGHAGDGEQIDELLMNNGWEPEFIVNTHTHIDHLGGNTYLMNKYKIPAYCSDRDIAFAHYSQLEAAYMYGGYPCEKLSKIFTHPGKIGFRTVEDNKLDGLEWSYLDGHTFGMIGVKTEDDIWFLGDAYLSRGFIKKHSFGYLYDVAGSINTLNALKEYDGKMFVPGHGDVENNIEEVCDLNIENHHNIMNCIKGICRDYRTADDVVQQIYEIYGFRASVSQHALLSSTTKSYLTYMQDRNELECKFIDNKMVWKCY